MKNAVPGAANAAPSAPLAIESLDLEARGVAHREGKVIFVEGALPGETVLATPTKRKRKYEIARLDHILRESASRVVPRCAHFDVCGGCSMQHLDPAAQVAAKQRVLEDNLWHLARLKPDQLLRPIHGPSWGYRYRARLGVRHVPTRGGVLIGFHEKKSSYVANMRECHILPAHVTALIEPLRGLVASLSIRDRLPQIELAVGEGATVFVLRILEALTPADEERLRRFADTHGVHLWLQPTGPDTIVPFWPPDPDPLWYSLPEYGVRMPFRATDFTQVNHQINRVLVDRALRLLDPQPADRVADLFCGLGNFTLPLATRCAEVIGIEGSASLLQRAADNARLNGLADKVSFQARNLFDFTRADLEALGRLDRLLIDPPRDGAAAVAKALAETGQERPRRIVYVSCSPSTLARDAATLVHEAGYRLSAAGVVNMFPHTSHVESMAVFDR
jgi:23S rRNA (uracil1939-C5)-methyltransferase